jgi:hypothetical protein
LYFLITSIQFFAIDFINFIVELLLIVLWYANNIHHLSLCRYYIKINLFYYFTISMKRKQVSKFIKIA